MKIKDYTVEDAKKKGTKIIVKHVETQKYLYQKPARRKQYGIYANTFVLGPYWHFATRFTVKFAVKRFSNSDNWELFIVED